MSVGRLSASAVSAAWMAAARSMLGAEGSFRRNAFVLTSGTFTAQVLPLLLYPAFTRIYAPAEFGVFATISLLATVAALLASGAYEHTILIAASRHLAAQVAAYAIARSGVVLVVLTALLVPVGGMAVARGLDPAVMAWLPAVPLMAAALVVLNAYSEWCVRNRYFGELSRVRIWQTSGVSAARLGLGVLLPSLNGFVAGDVVGKLLSAVRSAVMFRVRDRPYLHIHTLPRMRHAARRYQRVARYAMPDQLVSTLGGSVHVLFIGAAFGAEQLGYVTLVLSVMYVPVTVVSSAVKDVFRQRANTEFAREGTCRPTYRRLLAPLLLVAGAGFGILYAVAPALFPLLLGENWGVTGEYVRILTPLFFWNFVSMSLGGVLVIAQRTDVSLAWQVANLVLTVAALWLGTRILQDMVAALWCLSLARTGSYLLYMGLSYYFAERQPSAARA